MNAVVEEEVAGHEEDHEEDVPKSNCHHEDVAPLKGAILLLVWLKVTYFHQYLETIAGALNNSRCPHVQLPS